VFRGVQRDVQAGHSKLGEQVTRSGKHEGIPNTIWVRVDLT
jgi:hypothetical protein